MLAAAMSLPCDSPLSLRRYGASPGSHSHEHFQVLWGWHGVLELEIEGRGHRVAPGRIAVIGPGDRHDFQADRRGRGEARCFVFDGDDGRLEPLAGRVVNAPPSLPGLLHYLADVPQDRELWRLAVPMLMHGLPSQLEARPAARGRCIDWLALQAWVDARLHLPLTVADLAAQVHLSPARLTVRCQAQWGLTPLAWVRQRRLRAAVGWRAQGRGVAEVAAACGYRSPSALTAALRRCA